LTPGQQNAIPSNEIIGDSPLIKEAVVLARKVAPTDANVLLLGGDWARVRKYRPRRSTRPASGATKAFLGAWRLAAPQPKELALGGAERA